MIIAKCKREYKVLNLKKSDVEHLYISPITNEMHLIEFNAESKCENDEWLFINLSNYKDEIITPFLRLFDSTANLNIFDNDSFKTVEFLLSKPSENDELILKKITNSKRVENMSILQINGNQVGPRKLKVLNIPNGIQLDGNIDAYYDGEGKLYFKDFSKIHKIFKGLDVFYREANKEEVEEFKNNTCLYLSGYISDIGTRNLKMIALIKDNPKIRLDDSDYISSMINQANSFESITLQVNNNRFIILNESDLAQFLKLALGRYYINPLTDDKMVASTTKIIN